MIDWARLEPRMFVLAIGYSAIASMWIFEDRTAASFLIFMLLYFLINLIDHTDRELIR